MDIYAKELFVFKRKALDEHKEIRIYLPIAVVFSGGSYCIFGWLVF